IRASKTRTTDMATAPAASHNRENAKASARAQRRAMNEPNPSERKKAEGGTARRAVKGTSSPEAEEGGVRPGIERRANRTAFARKRRPIRRSRRPNRTSPVP